MSEFAALAAILIFAVLLDFGLMLGLRHHYQPRVQAGEEADRVVFLRGVYSPVLTWFKYRRLPKLAKISSVKDDIAPPAPPEPPAEPIQAQVKKPFSLFKALNRPWVEWAILLIAVTLFCWGILDLQAATRLPGNESEVFQSLDWSLINSLRYYHSFPLWNQYIQAGLPYIADPMLHVYNPLVTLPVLLLGVHAGFKLALYLSFLAAAFGMWRLGKTLGMNAAVRLWLALMYTFAGQPVGRFFQGQYLFVLGFAWIPWIVSSLFRAIETRRRRDIALSAIFMALLFFSGNAYYPFYMLITAILFGLVMLVRFRRRIPFVGFEPRKVLVYGLIALLAVGVIAIQLLPTAEFWPRLSKDTSLQGSHTLLQIFLDYTSKDNRRPDAFTALPAREEFYAYIGLTPFLALSLLPLAFWKRDRRALLFFLLVLLFAILWISLSYMPWRDFFVRTKLFVQFRHLLRVLVFGSFAIFALAAYGLDTLWKSFTESLSEAKSESGRQVTSHRQTTLAYAGMALLGVFMLVGVADEFNTNQQYVRTTQIYQPAYTVMSWIRARDPADFYVRHNPNNAWQDATISANLRYLDTWYHFTDIRDTGKALNRRPVQAAPLYISQTPAEPAPNAPQVALSGQVEGYDIFTLPESLPMAFSVQNEELSKDSSAGPLLRDQVTLLIPVFSSPQHLEVIAEGSQDQTLVVLITNYPGWRVKVDGQSQALKNIGGYLATDVQPGPHKYVFTYSPRSFYFGLLISLVASGLTAYLLLRDLHLDPQALRQQLRARRQGLRDFWQRLLERLPRLKPEITEALYRQGTLQPLQPLGLPEDSKWRIVIEQPGAGPRPIFRRWLWTSQELTASLARLVPLETALFGIAISLYLLTRLIGLADWPIYFFTDEAIQTIMAQDFVHNGLRNYDGEFLPTYFSKDPTYNLSSTSVYLQVIPYLLFGKSVFVTRAVSVLMTTFGAFLLGLILRDFFKLRYWWAGVLLLSIAPAWFLHSRTAFEMGEMIAFYIGFLYFYLLYRYKNPRYLYASLVFGALTFYTYSPAQFIMLFNGLFLLASDARYHWQNRKVALRGLLLLGLLALPFLRFYLAHPESPLQNLTTRAPFWMQPAPWSEKIGHYFSEYLSGLSPLYWFFPNQHDLARHLMKGYGHLLLVTLPFFFIGLVICLWKFHSSAHRLLLISLLAAPAGSALVAVGITRMLIFVIPAALLISLGVDLGMQGLEKLVNYLRDWRQKQKSSLDAGRMHVWLSVSLAVVLCGANIYMLRDALVNGPLWYQDYTLGGMQYGARQLFGAVKEYLKEHPDVNMIVSPSWTNGADAVADFFLPKGAPVRLGSIEGYLYQHLPLDENTVFVMIPSEMEKVLSTAKFKDVHIEKTLPYPNGKPGFFFVRLEYADNIDDLLAQEQEARRVLQEGTVTIDGQDVAVRYSMLDMGNIQNVFDGDPTSLVRTLEANPFVIELTFPELRAISGLTAIIGSANVQITAQLYSQPDAQPSVFQITYQGSVAAPQATLDFGQTVLAQKVRLEIKEPGISEPSHIHVWEIKFK